MEMFGLFHYLALKSFVKLRGAIVTDLMVSEYFYNDVIVQYEKTNLENIASIVLHKKGKCLHPKYSSPFDDRK